MATKTMGLQPADRSLPMSLDTGVTYNLDAFPEDRFNRLIPTQVLRMPSDLVVPIVQVVQLDVERDTYESSDVPKGSRALNKVGLRKLGTAAGVSIIDERRTDDGSDPDVCEVTCMAEMVLPTGQRVRAPGMKRVDLRRQSWASDNQRKKYASFFQEHVASRAENRAIRALLSLLASYPVAELRRPFAVVTFAPNMSHPEVRSRILDAMAPTVQALYGPEQAKQIGGGEAVTTVPAAPDDDEPGQYVEVQTNGKATVDRTTGEIVSDDAEPDWFGGAQEQPKADLASRLRAVSDANPRATAPASADQRTALKEALHGVSAAEAGIVLSEVFDIGQLAAIEARHAQAILEVGAAMGHERLRDEWKILAARLEAAEAAA